MKKTKDQNGHPKEDHSTSEIDLTFHTTTNSFSNRNNPKLQTTKAPLHKVNLVSDKQVQQCEYKIKLSHQTKWQVLSRTHLNLKTGIRIDMFKSS